MEEYRTLAELAEESELPARTIRFYIARGLLQGPLKAGRGAVYGREHLERLERIKGLQAEGRTLSEIGGVLGGAGAKNAAAESTAWWQHTVAEDVMVWTRAGMSPWRTRQVQAAIAQLAHQLQQERKE